MSVYSPLRAPPSGTDDPAAAATSRVWAEMMYSEGTPFSSRTGHAALRALRPRLALSDSLDDDDDDDDDDNDNDDEGSGGGGSESLDSALASGAGATEEVLYIFGGTDCRSRVSG